MKKLFTQYFNLFNYFLIIVTGDSMSPSYKNGDLLLVKRCNVNSCLLGDPILVKTKYYGNVLKFLASKRNGCIKLKAQSNLSIDCHQLGWIDDERVLGKVVKKLLFKIKH